MVSYHTTRDMLRVARGLNDLPNTPVPDTPGGPDREGLTGTLTLTGGAGFKRFGDWDNEAEADIAIAAAKAAGLDLAMVAATVLASRSGDNGRAASGRRPRGRFASSASNTPTSPALYSTMGTLTAISPYHRHHTGSGTADTLSALSGAAGGGGGVSTPGQDFRLQQLFGATTFSPEMSSGGGGTRSGGVGANESYKAGLAFHSLEMEHQQTLHDVLGRAAHVIGRLQHKLRTEIMLRRKAERERAALAGDVSQVKRRMAATEAAARRMVERMSRSTCLLSEYPICTDRSTPYPHDPISHAPYTIHHTLYPIPRTLMIP